MNEEIYGIVPNPLHNTFDTVSSQYWFYWRTMTLERSKFSSYHQGAAEAVGSQDLEVALLAKTGIISHSSSIFAELRLLAGSAHQNVPESFES